MSENNNTSENNITPRKNPKLITKETTENLIRLIQNETKPKIIQEHLNISKSTYKRLRENYENNLYNDLSNFKNQNEKKCGKRKTHDIERTIVASELALNSSLTLSNISDKLRNNNINASPTKCFRILKGMNYSHKIMTLVPVRRNSEDIKNLRALYASEIRNMNVRQLIFIDETGFNLHMAPKYGYSPVNTKCYKTVANSKGINVSLLCAIDINGIVAYDTKVGSFNTESFVRFIDEKIPNNTGNVIKFCIFDNASIHKSATVGQALSRKNFITRYLPAYTPQLNPIEEFFSCLKSRYNANTFKPRNQNDIVNIVNEILTSQNFNMEGYYRHMRSFIEEALMKNDFI